MSINLQQDFFSLFQLPIQFSCNQTALEQHYRVLQKRVHPDQFARAGDTEQRLVLQYATFINEAYQTLKHPIERGRYLLSLRGIAADEEKNTAMPPAFLMQQMEWREAIEEASHVQDVSQLENLAHALQQDMQAELADLARYLDVNDDQAAALAVRKCRFLQKLEIAIGDAIEASIH